MKKLICARLKPAARATSSSAAISSSVMPRPRNSGLVATFSIVQASSSPVAGEMMNAPRGQNRACSVLAMPILSPASAIAAPEFL